ncbi:hypothetical protein GLOIN_2v1771340 [Rhizophagus irregularis DAOM 181602=DAOM 197198]|nr:hypothetical protein GLOIN_2v1771340 [Rhizophagus irregularis DAOM 181602=DAOM 197198]
MVLSRATSLQLDINDEQNDNVDYIEEIKENIRERGKVYAGIFKLQIDRQMLRAYFRLHNFFHILIFRLATHI